MTEPQRRTGLSMQQRSLLRAGVYGQRWKWPVCGVVREICPGTASLGCPGKTAQAGPLSSAPLVPCFLHHDAWLCTVSTLPSLCTLTQLSSPWVFSSARHFPAQPSPSPALPSSPAFCPAQPSPAAQSALAPPHCPPQGAAELWALPPQPQPL